MPHRGELYDPTSEGPRSYPTDILLLLWLGCFCFLHSTRLHRRQVTTWAAVSRSGRSMSVFSDGVGENFSGGIGCGFAVEPNGVASTLSGQHERRLIDPVTARFAN
jgi:hypothetical protein